MPDTLQQAIAAIKSGDRETGKKLLLETLNVDRRNENAWLWMTKVVSSDDERIKCLENVLKINPDNETAARGLAVLEKESKRTEKQEVKTRQKPLKQLSTPPSSSEMNTTKQCPYCAETIKVAAKICRFCGRDLQAAKPSVTEQFQAPVATKIGPEKKKAKSSSKKSNLPLIIFFGIPVGLVGFCVLILLVMLSTQTPEVENESSAASPRLTRDQILEARKNFDVKVISFDASQEFGTSFPYSDYVRLKIINNSAVKLPYLTVLTKRYDSSGKMIGSSRAPSIPTNQILPGETVEYDYYPKGHLPGVKNITVEIEQVIDEDSIQFFKELK